MPKYLFYKMTHDSGFAPNPFWRYLTLATCTPNHMRADLQKGDWIIGVESSILANEREKANLNPDIEQLLIYIAKIDEVLTLDQYFRDPRFEKKKFKKSSNYKERRGDNVYYIEDGNWKWLRSHDHESDELCKLSEEEIFFNVEDLDKLWKDEKAREKYGVILQDIRGNRVFISKEFLYFGDKGVEFDKQFIECVPDRGIKYCPEEYANKLQDYINELIDKYGYGVHGNPILFSIKGKSEENDESCSK